MKLKIAYILIGIILVSTLAYAVTIETTIQSNVTVIGPPNWINLRNFTHQMNNSFSQTINASSVFGIDGYFLNDTTTFNISRSSGLITNKSTLTEKFHWLNITVNDTDGRGTSGIFYINVTSFGIPVSQCGGNFTLLEESSSKNPYGRLCYWLYF